MTALPEVGVVIGARDLVLTRDSLVRYAGASGDFNTIHYRDDVAASVGLPGVIAHGMLTMGVAVQPVVEWAAAAGGRIVEYGVRFTKPVVVDPADGASVRIEAKVAAVDETNRTVRVDLAVTAAGQSVLGKAQATVAFA